MIEAHESIHPGRWWRELDDGRYECFLCPRKCALRPGQRAFFYVRIGTEEGVALTTYGRSSGFCIDPIEKKPLNHFYPGTPILSFGTAGCNLGCKFCQNWDISKARSDDRLMNQAYPEDIVQSAIQHQSKRQGRRQPQSNFQRNNERSSLNRKQQIRPSVEQVRVQPIHR